VRPLAIVRKTLSDHRGVTLSMALVGLVMALLDLSIFPSYSAQLKDFEVPPALEGFMGESPIWAPEGFLNAEFFSWMPALYIVAGVIAATAVVAGEEGAGTLDLLLAQPVKRWQLLAARASGIALNVSLAALAALPGFAIAKTWVDFDLGMWRISEAVLYTLPLIWVFVAFGLWMGAALPTRGAAGATTSGAIVVTYFLNLFGATVDWLEPLRKLSPFYWGDCATVLVHGFDWVNAGGLLAFTALFAGLALWSFERRDISSGGREWSLLGILKRRPRP